MIVSFPSCRKDIIDGIIQVRKTHGGTLAGISMTQVIFEVSMFLKNIGTVQENDDKVNRSSQTTNFNNSSTNPVYCANFANRSLCVLKKGHQLI